jgi:carbon storage regulator
MLILARKKGETIHINDDVVITVMETSGSIVRLGIKAPDSTTVKRGEAYAKMKSESAPAGKES